jgi:hypothetical protein
MAPQAREQSNFRHQLSMPAGHALDLHEIVWSEIADPRSVERHHPRLRSLYVLKKAPPLRIRQPAISWLYPRHDEPN